MFETIEFRQQLQTAVAEAVGSAGMANYQELIVNLLWMMARNNESALMEAENRRPYGPRRGIPDALRSAGDVIQTAGLIARRDGRTLLTVNDVVGAYHARFCSIWPFCR